MHCQNIILLPAFFNSSLSAEFDRFAGHAIAVRAQWSGARCNARRSCRVFRVHSSPLAAHGLRFASTGYLDREHGRGPSPCNCVDGTTTPLRTGDAQ